MRRWRWTTLPTQCPLTMSFHGKHHHQYTPNLAPIDETSDATSSRVPLLSRSPTSPRGSFKRKHLNRDCPHLVPGEFETIIIAIPESDVPAKSGSWFYQIFLSTKRRKAISLVTVIAVIAAASACGWLWLKKSGQQLTVIHNT